MTIEELLFPRHTHGELCNPDEIVYREKDVIEVMKEFAKHHVKLALEAAHRNMQLPEEDLGFTLSTYPEEKIK